jgi:hypothetical protein
MEAKAPASTSAKKKGGRGRANSKLGRKRFKVADVASKAGGASRAVKESRMQPSGAGASEKLAISFAATLAADVREAAKLQTDGNVSAWLAEAARERLRQMYVDAALEMYEAKHGVITEEELAAIRKEWPR